MLWLVKSSFLDCSILSLTPHFCQNIIEHQHKQSQHNILTRVGIILTISSAK
eukprot:UN06635